MANAEPPVRYTRTAEVRAPGAKLDVALPRALVIVETIGLDPALRAAAARAAGVDPKLVDQLAAAGLPLPLASADSEAGARAKAAGLAGEIPGVTVIDPERNTPVWAMLAPAAALLLTLPLILMGLWLLIPLIWVIALAAIAAGVSVGGKRRQAIREAMALTGGAQQAAPSSATAQALLGRARDLRGQLGGLHELVARDLGESLSAIEQDIAALARREREEGADAVNADYARIAEALQAASMALGAPDREAGPDASERLKQQARALRATATEIGGPGRQGR